MRIITFDIETMGTQAGVARLLDKKGKEIQAPGNYKDAKKIEEYIAEKRAGLQAACEKEAALNPLYGQIVAASAFDGVEGGALMLSQEGIDGDEGRLLRLFADSLGDVDLVVSFNGHEFDEPWLVARMLKHGITPPAVLASRRYQFAPHCDLRQFLTRGKEFALGGLADWCAHFDVPCPDKDLGLTGADVGRLVREGQWETLYEYSFGGAVSTWNLLVKVWPALRQHISGAAHVALVGSDSADPLALPSAT